MSWKSSRPRSWLVYQLLRVRWWLWARVWLRLDVPRERLAARLAPWLLPEYGPYFYDEPAPSSFELTYTPGPPTPEDLAQLGLSLSEIHDAGLHIVTFEEALAELQHGQGEDELDALEDSLDAVEVGIRDLTDSGDRIELEDLIRGQGFDPDEFIEEDEPQ